MKTVIAAAALAGLAFAGTAHAADPAPVTVTFNDLVHGEIVTNQYDSLGLNIAAFNPNRDFDLAVAFDTTRTKTRDDDLEDPWSGGNMPSNTYLGNVLIIQENDKSIRDGVVKYPDDEGSRPAGTLSFTFDTDIDMIGFDVVDIEDNNVEFTYMDFYKDGAFFGFLSFSEFESGGSLDNGAVWGNNSANHIDAFSIVDRWGMTADKVVLHAGGSMGFDNLVFRPVPTPGTAALIGLGGLVTLRRRRA